MDTLDEQQRAARELSEKLFEIEINLGNQLMEIAYDDRVKYIYNPLDYAAETHRDFVRAALGASRTVNGTLPEENGANQEGPSPSNHGKPRTGVKILFIGINPGPYGMAQNGVSSSRHKTPDFIRLIEVAVLRESFLRRCRSETQISFETGWRFAVS